MPEPTPIDPQQPSRVPASLQELAERLRSADHLEPEVQEELADLMEELARSLASGTMSPQERTHLEESAAHLAHALHQQHDEGLLAAAKHGLEEAARQAEIKAPLATRTARQIIDALANLGI